MLLAILKSSIILQKSYTYLIINRNIMKLVFLLNQKIKTSIKYTSLVLGMSVLVIVKFFSGDESTGGLKNFSEETNDLFKINLAQADTPSTGGGGNGDAGGGGGGGGGGACGGDAGGSGNDVGDGCNGGPCSA
jgi:uncharacterized membrane protein YgcG